MKSRLSILLYHRVEAEPDPFFPRRPYATLFERQMQFVRRFFRVLPLSEAVERLRSNRLPPRAACITFDDGYANNVEVALPILQRLGLPAAFFIATNFLDGGRMWNDTLAETVRRWPDPILEWPELGMEGMPVATAEERLAVLRRLTAALKYQSLAEREARAGELASKLNTYLPDLMMASRQVVELHESGMEVGAHTCSHAILTMLKSEDARREIVSSRERLEALTGAPVRLFAYPNGRPGRDFSSEHVRMVRESGFAAAVTTAWGAADPNTDVYQLPRFTPWDRNPWLFTARLLRRRFGKSPGAEPIAASLDRVAGLGPVPKLDSMR